MISAKELIERNKTKNTVKKETYTKIMTQMCRKIEVAHTMGKEGTELKIPEFLFGYPMYDMRNVTIFVFRQLKRLGYRTSVLDVGRIYVAWNEKKPEKISKEEKSTLPTLSNLKKAADNIRKKYT
jgi:hypothetical protein